MSIQQALEEEEERGKPTFLTSRRPTSTLTSTLEVTQSTSTMQDRSAQGGEGGLAPALLPSAFCQLPSA